MFLKNPKNENFEHLTSIYESWSHFKPELKKILDQRGLPQLALMRVSCFNEHGRPSIEKISLDNFFNDIRNAKKHMVLCLEAETERKCDSFLLLSLIFAIVIMLYGKRSKAVADVPATIRPITAILAKFLCCQADEAKYGFLRRFMSIASNSSLSLPLLEALKFTYDNGLEVQFKAQHFHRIRLDFSSIDLLPPSDVCNELKTVRACFEEDLLQSSSESSLNGFVWFPIFTGLFKDHQIYNHENLKFRLVQEWQASKLFQKEDSNRRVDYAVVIESLGNVEDDLIAPCPVLLVESGADLEAENHEHKDQAKISCLMSACCMNLAHEMIKKGKKPEPVRVYGLLLGGTFARILVARPIVANIENDFYEVYATVSCDDSWGFDLRDDTNAQSSHELDPDSPKAFELFESDLAPSEPLPTIPASEELKDFFALIPTEPRRLQPAPDIPYEGSITADGLRKCELIVETVKARISLMRSNDCVETENRRFNSNYDPGIFYSTSGRSTKQTPSKSKLQVRPALNLDDEENNLSDPTNSPSSKRKRVMRLELTKETNYTELEINRRLYAMFPTFFARLYSYKLNQDETTSYVFENMIPLVENGWFGKIFENCNHSEFLLECSKFLLDCCFGLFLLHKHMKFIHSDISASNIMFSSIDRVWKLIDFDQAMPTAESLITSRKAGTKFFRAPEAQETGLFTEASDVYSLGKVGLELFFCHLTQFYLDEDKTINRAVDRLNGCFVMMTENNPSKRMSLLEAMKIALEVVELLDNDDQLVNDSVVISVESLFAKNEYKKPKYSVPDQSPNVNNSSFANIECALVSEKAN